MVKHDSVACAKVTIILVIHDECKPIMRLICIWKVYCFANLIFPSEDDGMTISSEQVEFFILKLDYEVKNVFSQIKGVISSKNRDNWGKRQAEGKIIKIRKFARRYLIFAAWWKLFVKCWLSWIPRQITVDFFHNFMPLSTSSGSKPILLSFDTFRK